MRNLLFILLFVPFLVSGQELKERLILTDNGDSAILNAHSITFDVNGNYLIEQKREGHYFFFTKTDSVGPLKFRTGSSTSEYLLVENTEIRYHQTNADKLFGPIPGKNLSHFREPVSQNTLHMAIPTLIDDSIYIYFDGAVINVVDTFSRAIWYTNQSRMSSSKVKFNYFENDDWMHISNNGNYIYTVENDSVSHLYANNRLIDTSSNSFNKMKINNDGNYIYAQGRKPYKNEETNLEYLYFLYANKQVFGPVRTAWKSEILDNGGYFISGNNGGTESYILINDNLFKGFDDESNITILDEKNFLFTYTKNNQQFINVNGDSFTLNYEKTFFPTMNKKGDFAMYGLRDYYLYKFVNGIEIKTPITRFGVRPTPLYISPNGQSINVFETDDSTYVYQGDSLLFPVLENTKPFRVEEGHEVLPIHHKYGKTKTENTLLYIEPDSVGYIVYNGTFSKPMHPVSERTWGDKHKMEGEVIAAEITENGFYLIQKLTGDSWQININNAHYVALDNVSKIFYKSCFFTGNRLVFYGVKGNSIYQFKITI